VVASPRPGIALRSARFCPMNYRNKLSTVLILQLALLHAHVFGAALFVETFETPSGQPKWQVPAGTAEVVSGQTGAVGTALRLKTALAGQAETRVIRPIDGWNQSESVAFIDFLVKPAANPEGSMASVYVNGSQIAFQVPAGSTQGQIWAYHGNDDDVTGSEEEWLKSPATYTVSTSTKQATGFSRITFRHDYAHQVWDLFVDGKLAAANLWFDGREEKLTSIEFFGSEVADMHIDQLQADPANMLFPDSDKDGLPDEWETANGSNPNLYDRDAIKPGTGKSFLDSYMTSLWTATAPNARNGGGASSASIPPLTVLASHQPVGSLKGSLAVGGDGSSTYSIPIDIPKGTAGMEPKLSLNYSSNGGNGVCGVGWSLGGLQKITRGPSSAAKDSYYDPVNFDGLDRFFLDGERLICTSGAYGASGSEYRTEMDSYARITLNGTAPGGLWWKLETKAGLIVELGSTEDAREAASGATGVLSWSVNKVADTCGNYYTIQYVTDASVIGYSSVNRRVSRLDYTGGAGRTPYCAIQFDYEDRDDKSRVFTPYAGYLVTKRMSKVRVCTKIGGSDDYFTNHSYRLSYQNSWQSGRSFLTSIQKFAEDTLPVPATTFAYDGLAQGESIWKDCGTQWPVYNASWDASGNVNSTVTVGDSGSSVRLDGDVARAWALPAGTTLAAGTKLTFKFHADSFVSGAYIGLDTNATYESSPARLFLIKGSGAAPSIAKAGTVTYAPDATGWQTITLDVGAVATGAHSHLILVNVDDNPNDGVSSAVIKDVRLYNSSSQQPSSVAPLAFTSQWEMPRFNDINDKDIGIRFMDLDGDGLAEMCDWRATDFNKDGNNVLTPTTVGQIYRNTGSGFTLDPTLRPPSSLPLSTRKADLSAYTYDRKHHLCASPVDINGDGRPDLLASTEAVQSGGTLSNRLTFFTWVNGTWQELTAYKLPFRPINKSSTAPYGGPERDQHYQWLDLDGDGYTDLLYHTTSMGKLLMDNPSVNNPDLDSNCTTAWLNKVHLGQGWKRADALGFPEPVTKVYPDEADPGRRVQDLNGDGRPDIAEAITIGTMETRRSYFLTSNTNGALTGWNAIPGVQPPPTSDWDLPQNINDWEKNAPFINGNSDAASTLLVDLNGDGLPDVQRSILSDGVCKTGTWINHGDGLGRWIAEPKATNVPPGTTYQPPNPLNFFYQSSQPFGYELVDLNGDGLVDIFYSNADNLVTPSVDNIAFLNNGNGWTERPEWGAPGTTRIFTSDSERLNGKRNARLQDLNGDGFPDLITGLINDTPKVWINQCRKEALTSVTDGFGTPLGVEYKRLNDPTPVAGGSNRVYQAYTGTLPAGHAVANGPALVVSRLIEPDGLGGQLVSRRYYGDLRTDRANESSLGFGWQEVYKDLYPAAGGVIPRGYSRSETARAYPFGGRVVKSESFVYVGQTDNRLPGVSIGYHPVLIETSSYGELATTAGVGGTVRRPVQTGSVSERYELNGTLMARTTVVQPLAKYDPYGFSLESTTTALDGLQTKTTSTYNHYTTGGKWWLGRLASSTVVKSKGSDSLSRTASFEYDTNTTGLLIRETDHRGIWVAYIHDTSGNVKSKATNAPLVDKNLQYTYDENGRFVKTQANDFGSSSTEYDSLRALVTSVTDIDGIKTEFFYDSYGTKNHTIRQDGIESAEITRYADNGSLPGPVASQLGNQVVRWAKTAQTSGSPWSSVYFDAMGRAVATETSILTAFNGSASVWRDVYTVTQYDQRGRKAKVSQPYFAGETPCWTTVEFDPVDRPMKTTYPDTSADEILLLETEANAANPLLKSTVKNREGKLLTRWDDQHGRMSKTLDPPTTGGEAPLQTAFEYTLDNQVSKVWVGGVNVLENKWDLALRHKEWVKDIDAGTTNYGYDQYDQVTSVTNPLGGGISTGYDDWGRVTSVTKPEGAYTTTYTSVAPIGKPAKITGTDGSEESFTYDPYGRIKFTTTTRFGETFTTQTTYDALGRVSSETDAGGLKLFHDYDTVFSAKIRTREAATNTTLWEPRAIDSFGRLTQQKLAHGVETMRTPNPANGTLTGIYTTGQGQLLQNIVYGWDKNGSLSDRNDLLANRKEIFFYDELNRLKSAEIVGQGTTSYEYETNGNLKVKGGDVLNYNGSRIHAVTSATIKGENRTYQYDAAGRVTSDTARTYGWTSFHQLSWVAQLSCLRLKSFDPADAAASGISGIPQQVQYLPSQGVSQFDFDAAGSRARQFLVRTFADTSSADVTTLYLGSYEREISRTTAAGASPVVQKTLHRHNLGGAIYTVEEKPGQEAVHKLATVLADHLGSTDVILVGTWTGGAWGNFKTERQSFTPWGERRSANTWSGLHTSSTDDRQTSGADYRRGFTSHEMLDDFGLIHMNGRIYDPELGRFLSPDPIVQVPEFSQNFNRYSYVLNNPLTYTDPSGHAISGLWKAFAMIVVAAVLYCTGFGAIVATALLGTLSSATALTVAGAAITYGNIVGAAAIGFVTGALDAALSGGNVSDVLRGGAIGAIQGAITAGFGNGVEGSFAAGDYGSAIGYSVGHGVVGGATNEAMGGKFQDGFLSASTSALAQGIPLGGKSYIGGLVKSSVIGGSAAEIGGGKFANGASTAAFQYITMSAASRYANDRRVLSGGKENARARTVFLGGSPEFPGHFWGALEREDGSIMKYDFAAAGYDGLAPGISGRVQALFKTLWIGGKVEYRQVSEESWNATLRDPKVRVYKFQMDEAHVNNVDAELSRQSQTPPRYGLLNANCSHRTMEAFGLRGFPTFLPGKQIEYIGGFAN